MTVVPRLFRESGHRRRAPAAGPHNGDEQALSVTAYTGDNPLLKHGFLRVSADLRHFEHADGTPAFWLGDTRWKCLCKRMTWEGFQEPTADREKKGFSVTDESSINFDMLQTGHGAWSRDRRGANGAVPAFKAAYDRPNILFIGGQAHFIDTWQAVNRCSDRSVT